ncbi:hypothetical protein N7G274_008025 [Stereocaulon virgatum]|uniref:DNA repair protein Dds20/Sfr1 n=1 Tax=Stereocaulon virgatum TaxID=373712 RepID=A0ABR4A093_9LECA
MSPMQSSKRRRLGNVSHTLSQPFKSPFKMSLKTKADSYANTHAIPLKTVSDVAETRTSPPPKINPLQNSTPLRRPMNVPHTPLSSELLALQRKHTHLLNQLSAARASLETSTQALKIESSDRDTELEALILTWRAASRAAAEDVFAGARDKVNKMGGLGAMRDRERQKMEVAWGWDEGSERREDKGEYDSSNEEDGTGFRLAQEEYEEQDKREKRTRTVEDHRRDDEGYTMDMMLKTLNVDLGIIGYDKELQRWVE